VANKFEPRTRLANIATRHQVLLERLKSQEVQDFVKIFAQMDLVTRQALNLSGVNRMGELTRKNLNELLRELREANQQVLNKGTEQLFKRIDELAEYESGFEKRTLEQIGLKGIVVPSIDSVLLLIRQRPISATGQLLEPFIKDWSQNEVERVNLMTQQAYAQNWTLNDLIKGIRGTKANGYKDGLIETSRRNAETIARTGWQHVANTSRLATWNANSDVVSGYEFLATLDGKTTQVCRSLDGRKFKLNEGPIPPMHPRCRSTTIAEINPNLGLDFLDKGATRSSLDGYIDADITYYEWLKGQNPEFIKEAIGKSRSELFIKGGLTAEEFGRLNLGRNFQPLTLDEMRNLEPLAFKRAGLN
jgi:SPP1 gp7 family putative phage head morphogenesis protein